MVERKPDGRFVCELVLNGNARAEAPTALGRKLLEEGAAKKVVPIYVGEPALGRRSGDLVEVATLAVTSAGTLVAVIDTIRRWLTGERNSPSGNTSSGSVSPGTGTGAADRTGGVTSITVVMGDDRVEIIEPSTAAEERLVEAFVRRHSPS